MCTCIALLLNTVVLAGAGITAEKSAKETLHILEQRQRRLGVMQPSEHLFVDLCSQQNNCFHPTKAYVITLVDCIAIAV